MTACVVPPPLDVDNADAAVNSPPSITSVRDPALTPLRPQSTLTLNTAMTGENVILEVTAFDLDLDDELIVQLFVDYSAIDEGPLVTCPTAAAPSPGAQRVIRCPTTGLCSPGPGTYTFEVEAYDTPPLLTPPFGAVPDAFFSNWTLELNCVAP
jgi:hypothetical protein